MKQNQRKKLYFYRVKHIETDKFLRNEQGQFRQFSSISAIKNYMAIRNLQPDKYEIYYFDGPANNGQKVEIS